ncbi:hypothetical protein KJ987_02680 [bacterium]|nr:hypothetical protein [bacterium]
MSKEKVYINLQGFLANVIVESLTRNTLFEKHYVSLAKCISLLQLGYETGAVLGYARGNKLDILNKMLSMQDMIFDNIIKDMQKSEKKRLDDFKKEHGGKPDTFADFIYWPLWERATGLTLDDLFKPLGWETLGRTRKRLSNIIQKKLGSKVPFEQAQPEIGGFLLGGLGFGSTFPDLTVKMFKNIYNKKNEGELWSISKTLGLSTPEDLSRRIGLSTPEGYPPTLREKEKLILGTVALYTSQYYPELLDPLDLRGHLSFIENL